MKNLHKKKYGFLNNLQNTCLCCKILENAFYYTEIKYGQQKVCEIKFETLLLSLLLRKISPPSAKAPTTHSLLLAISFNYTDNKINKTE